MILVKLLEKGVAASDKSAAAMLGQAPESTEVSDRTKLAINVSQVDLTAAGTDHSSAKSVAADAPLVQVIVTCVLTVYGGVVFQPNSDVSVHRCRCEQDSQILVILGAGQFELVTWHVAAEG